MPGGFDFQIRGNGGSLRHALTFEELTLCFVDFGGWRRYLYSVMENPLSSQNLPTPNALIGAKSPHKPRVLVVDDEKTNVELLERFLTREGYIVAKAYDGREALDSVKRMMPDAILLDVTMPVMNGLTVCAALRADYTTHSLPIIFLTARYALEDRLKGLRAGVDDYIGKPFDLEELKVRLEETLKRRRWDMSTHPLTHLPGSPVIEEEVWKHLRIGSPFAFAYFDIDNFKAYNDVYGYEAGDKVIKHLGGLLVSATELFPQGSAFVGHVGGDDFVCLSAMEPMRPLAQSIADAFDEHRYHWYRPEHSKQGFIQTENRMGQMQTYPLMALSIAVVSTTTRRILHYARLAEIASELKHFVKAQPHNGKSLLIWDRRGDIDKKEKNV